MEITSLISDASSATASKIASEACALLSARGKDNILASAASSASQKHAQWIARAPVTIKMRLFCLPYAGGVSENVFGR